MRSRGDLMREENARIFFARRNAAGLRPCIVPSDAEVAAVLGTCT